MSYGIGGVFDTATNNGVNTGGDYHHAFQNHYHSHSRPFPNGYHNSIRFNNQNRFDDNDDDPQLQPQQIQSQNQQRIYDDYELDDIDKPKLLMWGLTK